MLKLMQKLVLCSPIFLSSVLLVQCGDRPGPEGNDDIREWQGEVVGDRAAREAEIRDMRTNGQYARAAMLSMRLNYLDEITEAKTDPERVAIETKYQNLSIVLQDEIDGYKQGKTGPQFNSVYHPLEKDTVKNVFADFGDLYVKANAINQCNNRPVWEDINVEGPWAGYWYPFRDTALYRSTSGDQVPPLVKLDSVLTKAGKLAPGASIAAAEEKRFNGAVTDGWEGLCDAWSMASVMMPEPKGPLTVKKVEFSVSDLKALYTYVHLTYPKKTYGVVYRGDYETDGTFQDVRPEAFHRIVTKVLGEEHRAVFADHDPGILVWNKPLVGMRYKIEQHPKYDFAFNVTAYMRYIKHRSLETDILTGATGTTDYYAPTYKYVLYVDKKIVKNGAYKVVAGQWVGGSEREHPDTIKVPMLNGKIGSHNAVLNEHLGWFKENFIDSVLKVSKG